MSDARCPYEPEIPDPGWHNRHNRECTNSSAQRTGLSQLIQVQILSLLKMAYSRLVLALSALALAGVVVNADVQLHADDDDAWLRKDFRRNMIAEVRTHWAWQVHNWLHQE